MTENELKCKGYPKLLSNLEQKNSRSGSQGKVAVKDISSWSIPMKGIKSVLNNVIENELKCKCYPKLLSDLEQKNSRSGSQGKVAVKNISSWSIPMKGIKSVLINVTENKLKHKG